MINNNNKSTTTMPPAPATNMDIITTPYYNRRPFQRLHENSTAKKKQVRARRCFVFCSGASGAEPRHFCGVPI